MKKTKKKKEERKRANLRKLDPKTIQLKAGAAAATALTSQRTKTANRNKGSSQKKEHFKATNKR
jgi:hypothetical protein